jgi:hypothetical protein
MRGTGANEEQTDWKMGARLEIAKIRDGNNVEVDQNPGRSSLQVRQTLTSLPILCRGRSPQGRSLAALLIKEENPARSQPHPCIVWSVLVKYQAAPSSDPACHSLAERSGCAAPAWFASLTSWHLAGSHQPWRRAHAWRALLPFPGAVLSSATLEAALPRHRRSCERSLRNRL